MADKMGKRSEKTGEKSNFSVTCSLLSQYFKEKGGFGDLSLGIASRHLDQAKGIIRAPTTMKLMPGVDVSEERHAEDVAGQSSPKSMDLFPQHAGFDFSVSAAREESAVTSHHNKVSDKNQLTIFYGGKVFVFDNFPAEKVKDLMQMARKESLAAQNLGFTTPSSTVARVDFSHQNSSEVTSTSANQPVVVQNSIPKPAQAIASDMPIARRNSLHRFLEKRKDRITTKAPYQANASSSSSSAAVDAAKAADVQSWLGLGRLVSKPECSIQD